MVATLAAGDDGVRLPGDRRPSGTTRRLPAERCGPSPALRRHRVCLHFNPLSLSASIPNIANTTNASPIAGWLRCRHFARCWHTAMTSKIVVPSSAAAPHIFSAPCEIVAQASGTTRRLPAERCGPSPGALRRPLSVSAFQSPFTLGNQHTQYREYRQRIHGPVIPSDSPSYLSVLTQTDLPSLTTSTLP